MSDKIRAFLSIDINEDDLLNEIVEIQHLIDTNAAKIKLVERENIHFTWRFFGDIKKRRIEQIKEKLSEIDFGSFDITIGGVGTFPNIRRPRVIWIGVLDNIDKMRELKNRTDDLLASIGFPKERRKFIPHATIARVRSIHDKAHLQENIQSIANHKVGKMTVSKISMTKSTLTSSGPIYETLWQIEA
ncbi:RNA 2',3'-cyclic phosphodiesterase [Candidatus Thorarchaeota archaeon]|nr:MAG: RNA 2',3'-cyclic phosphodiesterase [Candidatus Thorarchaeota archaeon]